VPGIGLWSGAGLSQSEPIRKKFWNPKLKFKPHQIHPCYGVRRLILSLAWQFRY